MRVNVLPAVVAVIALAGCGQAAASGSQPSTDSERAPSPTLAAVDQPTRRLSAEVAGDDPGFRAAADAYDATGIERDVATATALRLTDVSAGFFGQRFSLSFWSPVSADEALHACHELVDYANEIDFPATSIEVKLKSYDDLTWSQLLVEVDQAGACTAVTS